eukprot:817365_1
MMAKRAQPSKPRGKSFKTDSVKRYTTPTHVTDSLNRLILKEFKSFCSVASDRTSLILARAQTRALAERTLSDTHIAPLVGSARDGRQVHPRVRAYWTEIFGEMRRAGELERSGKQSVKVSVPRDSGKQSG